MKLKNNTDSELWIHTLSLAASEEVELSLDEILLLAKSADFLSAITNGSVSLEAMGAKTALAFLKKEYNSNFAVDRNNEDQTLTGNDWITVEAVHKIWDLNGDYDEESNDFVVPFDGIYFQDGQFKISNLLGCTAVEIACFKRTEQGDDYWFILDKKIINLETEVQLSTATLFDLYEDERYTIKIKLYGILPSAKIEGDDDFTSWGYAFQRPMHW